MSKSWDRRIVLERSVGVSSASLMDLCNKFIAQGATRTRITIDLPDGEKQKIGDYRQLVDVSPSVLQRALDITVWASNEKSGSTWYVSFTKIKDDLLASYLKLEVTSEAEIYTLKGLVEHFVAQHSTAEALINSPFRSSAGTENRVMGRLVLPKGMTNLPPFGHEIGDPRISYEVPPIGVHAQKTKSSNILKWTLGALLIPGIAIYFYFRQATAGDRQAAAAETQSNHEGEALFLLSKPLIINLQERLRRYPNSTPLDLSLQNVGQHAATNVNLQCESAESHGPYIELGTIPPNTPKNISMNISEDATDPLHSRDGLSLHTIHLSYDDATGHHKIFFDTAGNAHDEK